MRFFKAEEAVPGRDHERSPAQLDVLDRNQLARLAARALEVAERDQVLRNGTCWSVAHPRQSVVPAPVVPVPDEEALGPPRPVAAPFDGVDERLVSLVTPAVFEAERYRALSHAVEQRRKATGLKTLAVTSPGLGDGKTLTAINLAGTLAQALEARVLLVDADLRRPAVGRLLGLGEAAGPGLAGAILDPRLALDQIVHARPPFNLSVICAGATPASPSEMLASPRLGELLHEARQRYDYIVLDTPPLVPVQDCRVIDRWVDGFLLVVAALRTPRRMVEEALTVLDRARILGLVFNAEEDYSISGYDSRYYRGYYAAGPPLPSGHPGALRRIVSSIGDSLRHRIGFGSANDSRRGGPG